MILDAEPDLEVVGEASNGTEAVALAQELEPDVVLIDLGCRRDGVEATSRITASHEDTRVAVLTTFDLDEYVYASLRAGASAFLLKDAKEDQSSRPSESPPRADPWSRRP